jgi:Flp pilus assembly protein TadD
MDRLRHRPGDERQLQECDTACIATRHSTSKTIGLLPRYRAHGTKNLRVAGRGRQLNRSLFALLLSVLIISGCAGRSAYEAPDGEDTGTSAMEQAITPASRSLLQSSRDQSASGNYVQAAASLERAIRIEPMQPLLWLELGRVRLLEGDYEQAEQLGRKARTLSAGDPTAETQSKLLIADALRAQGRSHDAYLLLAPDD